jgi:hypothetical protein
MQHVAGPDDRKQRLEFTKRLAIIKDKNDPACGLWVSR